MTPQKKQIRFIDAICGAGKTQGIIKEIKENTNLDDLYLYATPFVLETERIRDSVLEIETPEGSREFIVPQPRYDYESQTTSKTNALDELLERGANISMTHQLFRNLNDEHIEELGKYNLIIDEAIDILEIYDKKPENLEFLIKNNIITIDDETNKILVNEDDTSGFLKTDFDEDFLDLVRGGRMYLYGGATCIVELPLHIVKAFKSVTIMSYLFEGAYIWGLLNNDDDLEVIKCGIDDNENVIPYDLELEKERAKRCYDLINVYVGNGGARDFNVKMMIETNGDNLNYSDQQKWSKTKNGRLIKEQVENIARGYFRSVGAKVGDTLYTSYKPQLMIKSLNKCFIPYNVKSTNDFSDRFNLAYILDRNVNKALYNMANFKYGVSIDIDKNVLDSLVQWIFRSRIRKGQGVNLFLPSAKMRDLLHKWGTGEIFDKHV